MFGREHPADRRRLYAAQQKTGDGQRQQLIQFGPAYRGEAEFRQSLRNIPQQHDSSGFQI